MESARPHRRRTATAFHNVSHQFWARSARRQCLIVSTAFSPLDFVLIGCSRLGRKARRKKVFDQALGILAFHGAFFIFFPDLTQKIRDSFAKENLEEVSPGRPAVEPGELRPDGTVEDTIFEVIFGNPRNPETMG